jgi:hypothetical protein
MTTSTSWRWVLADLASARRTAADCSCWRVAAAAPAVAAPAVAAVAASANPLLLLLHCRRPRRRRRPLPLPRLPIARRCRSSPGRRSRWCFPPTAPWWTRWWAWSVTRACWAMRCGTWRATRCRTRRCLRRTACGTARPRRATRWRRRARRCRARRLARAAILCCRTASSWRHWARWRRRAARPRAPLPPRWRWPPRQPPPEAAACHSSCPLPAVAAAVVAVAS